MTKFNTNYDPCFDLKIWIKFCIQLTVEHISAMIIIPPATKLLGYTEISLSICLVFSETHLFLDFKSLSLSSSCMRLAHVLQPSQGYSLLIWGSNHQRSRSQCLEIKELFRDHNLLFFLSPTGMKTHSWTSSFIKNDPFWYWGQTVKC